MTNTKNNYAQKVIFELTHNWSIAPKGAKSLGVQPNGHRVYECIMRHTKNVAMLHLIVTDDVKVVAVEPNENLTVKDYYGLAKIGAKIEKNCGLTFECDKLVEEGLNIKVVKRESTVMDTIVPIVEKQSKLDKANEAIAKYTKKVQEATAKRDTIAATSTEKKLAKKLAK